MDRLRWDQTGLRLWQLPAARTDGRGWSRWGDRRPSAAEEIRIHDWLIERLALLRRERRGWWVRVRRFLGF